ncbi:general stress protein [Sutcliffiella rhizosphaerae]|uniref:General stress protein 17M-like domain-containing protein n=1 Tax=Sutcliffiella rhizosphaerae TaxID=2880967 RepID=A0ABM8YTA9_9BACI|nr:general stress protein [Sutcliffiella rhizosphaerae]CAG9623248.1 hypothetical protein BACCIP111883_04044 [Sutcliffiella rhizosphaerae]
MEKQQKEMVGSYLMEEDAMKKVDWLKNEGYRSEEIWVIRDRRGVLEQLGEGPITRDSKKMYTENQNKLSISTPVKAESLLTPETKSVATTLMEQGISKEEAYRYEFDVKVGKILILIDAHSKQKHISSTKSEHALLEDEHAEPNLKTNPKEQYKDSSKQTSVNRPLPDTHIDGNIPLDEQLLEGDPSNQYAEEEITSVHNEATVTNDKDTPNNGKRYAEKSSEKEVEKALLYHHGQPFSMAQSEEEDVYDKRVMKDGSLRVEDTISDESPGQGNKPLQE